MVIAASITLFGFYSYEGRISSSYSRSLTRLTPEFNLPNHQKAPSFTLLSVDGKKVSLSDFKGKIVIVDFWATWCPPCRKSIPDLVALQKKFKNYLAVIGISVDMDTKENVAPFVKNNGINFTVLYATPDVIQAYGNINAIPTSFIIDKHGDIAFQHIGLTAKSVFINEIKKLLK